MKRLFFIISLVISVTLFTHLTASASTCTFTWGQVTQNTDGSAITDLEGYRLYTSMQSGTYNFGFPNVDVKVTDLQLPSSPTTTTDCQEGSFWVVTAYDSFDPPNESGPSNEVQVPLPDATVPGMPGGMGVENVTPDTQCPTDGLVAYWKFDDGAGSTTAADSSGNANNGTLVNMDAQTAWVAGMSQGALSFDGADDLLDVPVSTTYKSTNISISAWIKPGTTQNNYAAVVSLPFRTTNWTTPYVSYSLSRDGDNEYTKFAVTTGGVIYAAQSAGAEWFGGTWFHAVLTYDGETIKGYIAGQEAAVSTAPSGDIDYTGGTAKLAIGSRGAYSTGEYLSGALDEIRIFNRAITATEVANLYNAGAGCQ